MLRRIPDTGTNFLVVPQQVAENAAAILNGPMEQLTGIQGFFYGTSTACASGITLEELDNALPPLEFAIPDFDGNPTVVSKDLGRREVRQVQLKREGASVRVSASSRRRGQA